MSKSRDDNHAFHDMRLSAHSLTLTDHVRLNGGGNLIDDMVTRLTAQAQGWYTANRINNPDRPDQFAFGGKKDPKSIYAQVPSRSIPRQRSSGKTKITPDNAYVRHGRGNWKALPRTS